MNQSTHTVIHFTTEKLTPSSPILQRQAAPRTHEPSLRQGSVYQTNALYKSPESSSCVPATAVCIKPHVSYFSSHLIPRLIFPSLSSTHHMHTWERPLPARRRRWAPSPSQALRVGQWGIKQKHANTQEEKKKTGLYFLIFQPHARREWTLLL